MPETAAQLTQTDRAILRVLQADCRVTNQELAERVNMSTSACWRRVQALEREGVINSYVARLTPKKLGLGFSALAQVTLNRHDAAAVDGFVGAVLDRPEVLACFATTGDADYILRVVAEDLESYERFLSGFLFKQGGITHVKTLVVVRAHKDSTELPV